jgi:hypothetical protein
LGKGGNRVGRGRRIWVNMRKCHGRELWRERKKEAGYEDRLILSCGPSSTEYDIHKQYTIHTHCSMYIVHTLHYINMIKNIIWHDSINLALTIHCLYSTRRRTL